MRTNDVLAPGFPCICLNPTLPFLHEFLRRKIKIWMILSCQTWETCHLDEAGAFVLRLFWENFKRDCCPTDFISPLSVSRYQKEIKERCTLSVVYIRSRRTRDAGHDSKFAANSHRTGSSTSVSKPANSRMTQLSQSCSDSEMCLRLPTKWLKTELASENAWA